MKRQTREINTNTINTHGLEEEDERDKKVSNNVFTAEEKVRKKEQRRGCL